MTISRQVIIDLLPLYFAHEASADTIKLVEAYLAEHPDFAKTIRQELQLSETKTLTIQTNEDDEMRILKKTQRLISIRSFFFPLAIFFSLCLFAFGDVSWSDIDGIHWLWLDYPPGAYICGSLAAVFWDRLPAGTKTPSRNRILTMVMNH